MVAQILRQATRGYDIPFSSSSGFLDVSACLSMSKRGAIVRQLVGRPAGRKPTINTPFTS